MLPVVVNGETPDRRRRTRLRLTYPLRLYRPGEESRIETKTQNISCEGFFCITDRVFSPSEFLECELVIPSAELGQPLERDMILRCRAEVVRVVQQAGEKAFGVACRLADYTIGRQVVQPDLPVECSV